MFKKAHTHTKKLLPPKRKC